jgi:hypothetical protein
LAPTKKMQAGCRQDAGCRQHQAAGFRFVEGAKSLGRAERTSVGDEASWCMTALRLCWILDTGRLRYVSRHSPAGTQKPTFLPCTCETVFAMYSIHWEGPR